MDRREFLKGLLGAAVLATLPAQVVEAFVSGETDHIDCNGIHIDYANKTIKLCESFRKAHPKGVTCIGLYAILAEKWAQEKLPDFPMLETPAQRIGLHEDGYEDLAGSAINCTKLRRV